VAEGRACTARYIPAQQLDTIVWQDLCQVLTDPAIVSQALERAQQGLWLPQELHARRTMLHQSLSSNERQQARLLDAYLAEIVELAEFERKRAELAQKSEVLKAQLRQLEAMAAQHLELTQVAHAIEDVCRQLRVGLEQATFEQQRALVELLIDCVVVADTDVEIRYVMPLANTGPPRRLCHLRIDYRALVPARLRDGPGGGGRPDRVLSVLQHGATASESGLSDARRDSLRDVGDFTSFGHFVV
jgi:site-specific DNA recombinase